MLDTQTFTDANLGMYAGRIDEIKNAYLNHYLRQWAQNNGFLSEVEEITAVDENGKPEFDLLQAVSSHANLIAASIQSYLDRVGLLKETIKEGTDILTAKYPDAGLDAAAGGFSGGGSNDFGGGDNGGDMGMGGSSDLGGGDTGGLDLDAPMGAGTSETGEPTLGGEAGNSELPENEEETEEEEGEEEGNQPPGQKPPTP
jgi:hypothetical protein